MTPTRLSLSDAFGRALRSEMSERNMPHEVLRSRSQIDPATLNRLQSGTRLPDLYSLYSLSKALDLAPEALVIRTDMHVKEKGYGDDVGIMFQRRPRIFRLIGSDGQERGEAFGRFWDAHSRGSTEPWAVAVAVYGRTAIYELTPFKPGDGE